MLKEKEKLALAYAAKRAEEEEQSKKLGGRILMMLTKLDNDETPKEYSTSGLELGPARTRILASQVAYNKTLTNLHLSRANIKDEDGVEVAKILYNNKVLRKLELEGNNLGPKSAKEFGKALRINKTLQFLDLESNQLTADGEDNPGVIELIASLEHNTTLLSLNLANNKLEGPIGSAIKSMLDKNHTLIDLEVGFNSFSIADVSLFV
jgi:Leucine-rich repeat (LRR) protein